MRQASDAQALPDWSTLIERADLGGPLRELARRTALQGREGRTLLLAMAHHDLILADPAMLAQLEARLEPLLGERPRLRCIGSDAVDSPAARAARQQSGVLAEAHAALDADPVVAELRKAFGARIVPESIRPVEQSP
jgi:DNA polymerase-3 subunit gamma/tau